MYWIEDGVTLAIVVSAASMVLASGLTIVFVLTRCEAKRERPPRIQYVNSSVVPVSVDEHAQESQERSRVCSHVIVSGV